MVLVRLTNASTSLRILCSYWGKTHVHFCVGMSSLHHVAIQWRNNKYTIKYNKNVWDTQKRSFPQMNCTSRMISSWLPNKLSMVQWLSVSFFTLSIKIFEFLFPFSKWIHSPTVLISLITMIHFIPHVFFTSFYSKINFSCSTWKFFMFHETKFNQAYIDVKKM